MGLADRAHLDDLSLDELDALVLVEDAGLAQSPVFLEGEAAPLADHRHLVLSRLDATALGHVRQRPIFDTGSRAPVDDLSRDARLTRVPATPAGGLPGAAPGGRAVCASRCRGGAPPPPGAARSTS